MVSYMNTDTTEEKIYQAAIKEFGEHGFYGARIDRIAKRAKINKAMIYYHFKSKEALYVEIIINLYKLINENVFRDFPENINPYEQIQYLVSNFIDTLLSTEPEIVKIIMREIVSGGKYFKKILIPNVITPFQQKSFEVIEKGKRIGVFNDIDPYYTFFQIVGSIIFFNIVRVVLKGTPPGDILFSGNYKDKFINNLYTILESGIIKHGDSDAV